MNILQDLFGSVQEVAQNAVPDPSEHMQHALDTTTFDETMQQFLETPWSEQ